MTPPLALADVDWRAVIAAGLLAYYGITATVDGTAPLVCDCLEVTCDGDHLWVTAQQRAGDAR